MGLLGQVLPQYLEAMLRRWQRGLPDVNALQVEYVYLPSQSSNLVSKFH